MSPGDVHSYTNQGFGLLTSNLHGLSLYILRHRQDSPCTADAKCPVVRSCPARGSLDRSTQKGFDRSKKVIVCEYAGFDVLSQSDKSQCAPVCIPIERVWFLQAFAVIVVDVAIEQPTCSPAQYC